MATDLSDTSPLPQQPTVPQSTKTVSPRRAVLAGALGNLIEYYDFAVYGVLAVTLGPLFFPSNQPGVSILSTLAVFAVAFAMRPIGGYFFGRLGDRRGRRRALVITVVGMGLASGAVGVLPTHSAAGAFAPVLLVLARLIQGFCAGGEVTGSTIYIAESAPPRKRGFFLSFSAMAIIGSFSVSAAVVGVTAAAITPAQMASWGWRIPFLIALPLAAFCLWARLRMGETHEFETMVKRHEVERNPFLRTLKEHPSALVRVFCIFLGNAGIGYIGQTYLSIYLIGTRGFDKNTVYWASAVAIALACCTFPFTGMLVDRFGRKPTLIAGYGIFVILAWPMFIVLSATSSWLVAGVIIFAYMVLYSVNDVAVLVVSTELFPRRVRYTGMALGINLATVVAGGTAPYGAQWLVHTTGDAKSPALWIIVTALISVIASLTLRETSRDELPV